MKKSTILKNWLANLPEKAKEKVRLINLKNSATPDAIDLDNHLYHFIFIYGSLKEGFGNHPFLKDGFSYKVGEVLTVRDDFRMFGLASVPSSNFPIVLAGDSFVKRKTEGQIHGELYLTHTKTIMELDKLESNGLAYNRTLIRVTTPHLETRTFDAWMYIGDNDYWHARKKQLCLCGYNDEVNIYKWTKDHERSNSN